MKPNDFPFTTPQVRHFSKYGLAGSDDEADEENQPPNNINNKPKVDKSGKPTPPPAVLGKKGKL